ncbi:MAG: NAD(P)/FAD-dependent oxidoreductase [Fibrobacteraceae bacterium]|nr:NAD(P)/FAD-dependent oxidoreductase [Fibrobacteraceae bacterium]
MKRTEYDVLVVGAGPAGSVAARNLARSGHSVLLIEKRERIGFPVRCGEASTKLDSLQQEFGPIDLNCIETELNGLYVYGPGGVELDAAIPNVGVMLNREKFDPCLARLAENAGAEVETFARASAIGEDDGNFRTVSIVTSRGTETIKARMVIAADGVESRIGRLAGIVSEMKPSTTCTGVDIEVEGILTRPDYLTFWQGRDFINDGYIWSFPKLKSNVTNFGAGFLIPPKKGEDIEEIALKYLKKFFPDAKVNKVVGGLIPVSGNLEHYVKDRLLLAGDAAHHTNPLTGGGIASAMRAGQIAAEVVGAGLDSGDLSARYLHVYEKRCMERFGKEHLKIMKFRRFLLALPREEQIQVYELIRAFLKNGKSKFFVRKMPLKFLKYAFRFLKFK